MPNSIKITRVILEIKKHGRKDTKFTPRRGRHIPMWSNSMTLNFKTVSTILKCSCKGTVFEGRNTASGPTAYNTLLRDTLRKYELSLTTTTWRGLRIQMEKTASKYEGYLNVQWISRRGCRQGVVLDQRLGREPVTDNNESCYEMTGLGRALWNCLINGIQARDVEAGMSGSVAYELYYQG